MSGLESSLMLPALGILAAAQLGLVSGIVSAPHCATMCGGLSYSACRSGPGVILYQIGRLLGYLGLALVLGGLGQEVPTLLSERFQLTLGIAMSTLLIGMGLSTWTKVTPTHFPLSIRGKLGRTLRALAQKNSFLMGLSSILLPCGPLYTMLGAVLIFQSKFAGLAFMTAFWLGTLPGLILLPLALKKSLRSLGPNQAKLNSIFLVGLGLTSIALKLWPLMTKGHSCH